MADALQRVRAALRAQGREDADSATIVTGACTLRAPGSTFLPPAVAIAFKSACLGPFFSRYAVQKGRAVEIEPGSFESSKLGRYHFQADPAAVPSSNNHPFQDWLDRLRDFTGTHSLSPAPLVPWPVYRGTVLHAISCCLVGLEMYWQVLMLSVATELSGDNFHQYLALLGRGEDAEDEMDRILALLSPDSRAEWGEYIELDCHAKSDLSKEGSTAEELVLFYHPIIVQAASNVLGRVIVVMEILDAKDNGEKARAKRGTAVPKQGVFAPWRSAPALPPLCIAWEDAAHSRLVPLVPTSLSESSCCVLPDQLVPPVVYARVFLDMHALEEGAASHWDHVKSETLALTRQRKCQLVTPAAKCLSPQYVSELLAVMEGTFKQVTGLSLQMLADVRSLLFDLGVGEVAADELVHDVCDSLEHGRIFYNAVSCQVSVRRGIYGSQDLAAPHGRYYRAAIEQTGMAAAEPSHEAGAANASSAGDGAGRRHPFSAAGRSVGGVQLLGIDVPTCMPPGMLRVYVSVERVRREAAAAGAPAARGEEDGEGLAGAVGADAGLSGDCGEPGAVPESVVLIVKNTSPTGQVRTARVSKALGDIQVALGLEVPLRETGVHKIAISLSPVHAPTSAEAPLSVAVLDGGEYDVVVEHGADERRSNQDAHGARADYAHGIRLKVEPTCLFSMSAGGLVPSDKVVCRVTGDAEHMRACSESGEPHYRNGDCTHTPSRPGSCCDRKHFWEGLEYDCYPVIFNLSLNCPTHVDPSGNTVVAIVWHEGESDVCRNSNVFQVAAAIVEKFWPDEPECPWYGWETQLSDVILRELPQDRDSKHRDCARRKWLSRFVGGVDLSH